MDRSEIYCQAWAERLQSQEALNRDFDTRAIGILSLGAAIVAAGALVLRFARPEMADAPINTLALSMFGVLVLFFAVTAVYSILTFRPRKGRWSEGPKAEAFDEAMVYRGKDLARWLGRVYRNSVCHNIAIIEEKGDFLNVAIVSLSAQVGALAALAIYYLI